MIKSTVSFLVAGTLLDAPRVFDNLDRKGFDKLQDRLMRAVDKLRAIGAERSGGKKTQASGVDPQPITVAVSATDDGAPFVDYSLTYHGIGAPERQFFVGLVEGELGGHGKH